MDLNSDFSLYKIHLDDFFTFLIFLIERSVDSETMGDLIWEKGIYYKNNTNVPFSGKINGNIKSQIQVEKKEGTWVRY